MMKPILLLAVLAAACLLEVTGKKGKKGPVWLLDDDGKCYERNRKDGTRVASCDTATKARQEVENLGTRVGDLKTLVAQQQERIDNIAAALENEGQEKECPPNFTIRYQKSCYFYDWTWPTFYEAKKECEALGAKLVEVETPEENAFLLDEVSDYLVYTSMWLGGSDEETEGTYVWVSDNRPINLTNWYANIGQSSTRNCITMPDRDGRWNLTDCNLGSALVCEFDRTD